ncbi:benzoate-CoA ligase family protein [Planctomycetota bacterium]|nr:benzoate-CoA ligase family protein [Planctomycetota bacterium]
MSTTPEFPDQFNMASYFVDSNIDAGRADKRALHFEGTDYTFGEVYRSVNRAGNGLLQLGLQPEQRLLTILQDRPEFAWFWFGGIKAGGVATQINPLLPEKDFAYFLNYTKAPITAVDEVALENFIPACKQAKYLKHVLVRTDGELPTLPNGITAHRFSEWLAAQSPEFAPAPTHKDDPAVWLFTSGTTGNSKGAVHFHSHFAYNTDVYAKQFIGMRESDITVSGPRLFFGYATGTNLMFPWAVGAETVLFADHPKPTKLFELIQKHKCTVFTSVPTLINKMLASDERSDISSLRFMWSAGEALPQDLHDKWDAKFGVPIIDGIGSAESFHIYISNSPTDVKPGSLGRLVPGYEAKLLDDNAKPVAKGDVGTLWVGGASAALYYHNAYDKSVEHLRGGWIVSGDKFREDADGYWYYEGRGDDLIKSGGIYVSPLEVENCLMQHKAVKEVCVIGQPDGAGLMKPLAIVVCNDDVKACDELGAEIINHAKDKLARYKAPHWVKFRTEALPRNDRDKIDRKKLRAELTE